MKIMIARCLCEKIEFEFEPSDGAAMNCYCSICRRSHGADYATQVLSKKSSLKFIKGQALLSEYSSSDMGVRAFCSCCGSRLMNYAKRGSDYMSVSLSAVSSEHSIKPCANVQVASKAPWVSHAPDIPSYEIFPDDIYKYMK